ncbi:hypothetical protein WJ71_09525 [Burkholderia ubonensis]|nr:hypothetical protein WJ71_09525 [Burkholderia ubonensis]
MLRFHLNPHIKAILRKFFADTSTPVERGFEISHEDMLVGHGANPCFLTLVFLPLWTASDDYSYF